MILATCAQYALVVLTGVLQLNSSHKNISMMDTLRTIGLTLITTIMFKVIEIILVIFTVLLITLLNNLETRIPVWEDTRYTWNEWARTTPDGKTIGYCLRNLRASFIGTDEEQMQKLGFEHTTAWYIERFISTSTIPFISLKTCFNLNGLETKST